MPGQDQPERLGTPNSELGTKLTLRARLTLAFASIIVVTLLLAGSAFVFILRDYQIRRETSRVAELTQPLSNQVRSLEQLGTSTEEIISYLERQADELDLRVLLADSRGSIFADTGETLVGRQLQIQTPARFGLQRRVRQAIINGPEGEISFMVSLAINPPNAQTPSTSPAPPPGASVGERFLGRQSGYLVALSVPRQSLATAWLELLPRLSLAALLALLLSVAVAWPLAASIARPLASMTRAAEGIARGRLDQQIPVRGRDEVGRLARAFNLMAREVSASQRTLRDFLANVSHDLRTPLTSIQGFSQALTDGTLADRAEVAEAGRIINQEAERMSRLVDDLLFLSKIESGQAPLESHELDLASLVAGRLEAASHRAAEASIELRWRPDAALIVAGDSVSMERVVDNLLDNALRFTPLGGSVTVRLSRAPGLSGDDDRPRAVISVHNTGPAIPADDLSRVFERFYQIDRSRAAGSSGLGLAISREIVQAHGGRCWAESSAEGGTEFFVELPARPALAGERQSTHLGDHEKSPTSVLPVGSTSSTRS